MTVTIDQIERTEAYKIDPFMVDQIRLDVHFIDGSVATLSEEDKDWQEITASFSELPGFMKGWWRKTVTPPFEECRIEIFRRGQPTVGDNE